MVGQDFHTRGKRADEQLIILPQLMSGEITEYHGEFYDFPALKMSPGTRQAVPIMVGGYSPAAMRRAARHDGWMATSHEEEAIYPLLDQLNTIRKEEKSSNKPFNIWSGILNPGPETHQRLEAAGVTMTNGTNFLDPAGKVNPSSIDDKKRNWKHLQRSFWFNTQAAS